MDIIEATKHLHEISTVVRTIYSVIFVALACFYVTRIFRAIKSGNAEVVKLRVAGIIFLTVLYVSVLINHSVLFQISVAIAYACWQFGEDILSSKAGVA